jgi:hypothetical protein
MGKRNGQQKRKLKSIQRRINIAQKNQSTRNRLRAKLGLPEPEVRLHMSSDMMAKINHQYIPLLYIKN